MKKYGNEEDSEVKIVDDPNVEKVGKSVRKGKLVPHFRGKDEDDIEVDDTDDDS